MTHPRGQGAHRRPEAVRLFLRRPSGVGEVAADVVRVVGVVSVLAAFIWWQPTDAGIVALATPALFVPRFLGLRAGLDIASSVIVLVAAWSNVLDLYRTVPGWDLLLHFVCTGLLAAVAYVALAQSRVVPAPQSPAFLRRSAIVVTTLIGLAISALWEMVEWLGKAYVTDEIFVTYDDTIADMAVGGLGALIAGLIVARVRLTRVRSE